jgi:hypothetical protein
MIEIVRNPTDRQLRQFAVAWMVFFGLIGGMVVGSRGWPTAATLLWAVVVLAAVPWLFLPRMAKPAFLGLSYATFPIGWVVSHVLLAAIYYGVFTPIGLGMRLIGRDSLRRRFDRDCSSYWIPRKQAPQVERYFRQY